MGVQDAVLTRDAMREIARRELDTSKLQVHVTHGVVHIMGIAHPLHGHSADPHHELEIISRILRSKPGIRDVILEVDVTKRLEL